MGRKSLIAGGSGSASAILKKAQQKTIASPAIDICEEALAKRAEERKTLPQHPLQFTRVGHSSRRKNEVTFNFHPLAKTYPHHSALLNQLLNGMSLSVSSGVSTSTIRAAYNCPETFINFLNNGNLSNKEVMTVSDIDEFVLQAFKTHLTSNFPGSRSSIPKTYRRLTNALTVLRQRYSEDPSIGDNSFIPRGPQPKNKQTEGYNPNQMKELIRCCLKDIKAIKKFHADYNTLDSNSPQLSIVENGHNNPWREDPDRRFMEILATIKNEWPHYPHFMTLDSVKLFLGRQMGGSEQRQLRTRVEKALENCSGKISFMNGELGRGAIYAAQHFVPDTIFPFLLLTQIATGFNAECVKFMSDNFKEFIVDDLVDPDNYAIIYGYKAKTDKAIPVRSKKKQANGAYQLLQYVASIINKYKESEYYISGVLFQYTRAMLATRKDEGLICSFHGNGSRFSRMGQAFVKRHALGELIGTTVDARKVRSGFGTILQEGGVSVSRIGEHYGHSDAQQNPETADKHYLSDTASIAVKNKVIADLQNKLVSDITNYKYRIVSSITLQQMRDAINSAKDSAERTKKINEVAQELNLEEKVVVHLLDSGAQTYILACEDMTKPTWPGHEDFVRNGHCRQYNKCCMCKQAVVFPEALPYIAKRIMDVDDSQKTMTAIEWVANLGNERDAWSNILGAWNNKQQVEDAWEAAKSGKILLPKVMRGGTR